MSKGIGRHARQVDEAILADEREAFIRENAAAVVARQEALIARHRREIRKLLAAKTTLRRELHNARRRIAELEAAK